MRKSELSGVLSGKGTCNCGNKFVTGSTKRNIHVEVCSSAIRSTQDSRGPIRHVVLSRSSIRSTASTTTDRSIHTWMDRAEIFSQLFFN